jgi:AcrR family transcriptional regulator
MAAPTPISDSDLTQRILDRARDRFFRLGLRAFTMDDLAQDLGVSKKTLYVHFPSKNAIAERIVDFIGRTLRKRFDAILDNTDTSFPQKLCAVIDIIGNTIAKVSPTMLRDLQRDAPFLFQKIEELRQKNIPYVFGRLLREGMTAGLVRPEIEVAFATEFWLQAVRGLMHPDTLERVQLTPRQILDRAIPLFFNGLLTSTGRNEYATHIATGQSQNAPSVI